MRLPDDDDILRNVLERNAASFPEREMVTFESGESWTAREALDQARKAASVLQSRGVRLGDTVGALLPNGPDFLRTWWGSHLLGATLSPFNLALKGHLFDHLLSLATPRVLVTKAEFAEHVPPGARAYEVVEASDLAQGTTACAAPAPPLTLADTHVLQATSGTTGPSRMWTMSMFHHLLHGFYMEGLTEHDRFLVDLPLFHAAAMGIVTSCQMTGIPVALRTKPSLSRYFQVAREAGATAGFLVGSMAAKLLSNPPTPDDRLHGIQMLVAAPLPPLLEEFCARFGVARVVTGYGSTETGPCLVSNGEGLPTPGSCGRLMDAWRARLVDPDGNDARIGEVGELLVRPLDSVLRSEHYVKDAQATAQAWHGGWFHTGDLFRQAGNGDYFFVDRAKDSVRRRGENISSFEVEAEVRAHPGVQAVACVAAPSPEGVDDEVKVWVVPEENVTLDFADLAAFLVEGMPRYMIPRYYQLIDQLPMTETMRIQKHVLRSRGNSDQTWEFLPRSERLPPTTMSVGKDTTA